MIIKMEMPAIFETCIL